MPRRKDPRATLTAIAADQRPSIEVTETKAPRPLIEHDHLIDKLGPFVRRTLDRKDAEKLLDDAADDLAGLVMPLFDGLCEDAGELMTAADLAGGTWVDPANGDELTVFDGDVQWQLTLTRKDLEVGSRGEKAMNADARRLCPEAVRLELTVDLLDPADADVLLKAIPAETIARLFKVVHVRRAPSNDEVRELFRKKGTRKALQALIAAGAVKVKQFPKLIPHARSE